MKELALTQEQFDSWKKQEQRQWIKDHPTSKFGQHPTSPVNKELPKTALTPGQRKKEAEKKFLEIVKSKSPDDRKAFLAARNAGVAIPPAWTNITYHEKPVDGVIAEGTDAKGRRQRVEDAAYRQGRIAEKHKRIQATLEPKFNSIVNKLKRNLDSPEAQVLYLIAKSGFRIGDRTDGKTEHQAYGASNLLGKHAKVDGDTVTFDFIGKEGVQQYHVIKDPLIAKMVAGKEPDERIFKTNAEKVRNAWKELGGEKVHDIRSLLATRIAKNIIAKTIKPNNDKEYRALQKKVAEAASKKLGNRPSEALNTYVDHEVFRNLLSDRSGITETALAKRAHVLTEYDTDAQEFEEIPDKDEEQAMKKELDKNRNTSRIDKNKERALMETAILLVAEKALSRLELSSEADDRKIASLRQRLKQIREKHEQDQSRYATQVDNLRQQIRLLNNKDEER